MVALATGADMSLSKTSGDQWTKSTELLWSEKDASSVRPNPLEITSITTSARIQSLVVIISKRIIVLEIFHDFSTKDPMHEKFQFFFLKNIPLSSVKFPCGFSDGARSTISHFLP